MKGVARRPAAGSACRPVADRGVSRGRLVLSVVRPAFWEHWKPAGRRELARSAVAGAVRQRCAPAGPAGAQRDSTGHQPDQLARSADPGCGVRAARGYQRAPRRRRKRAGKQNVHRAFPQVDGAQCPARGLVARGGVEPPTFRFSVGRSYQLSYLAVLGVAVLTGLEPATSALTGRRALQLLHRTLLWFLSNSRC